ncbi:MAG: DUF3299 domain-containing protein [Deltaproteobacteria bacterium]|nr:DUF3299 domain-containing protein [Deltaproteobacteria bacterium]
MKKHTFIIFVPLLALFVPSPAVSAAAGGSEGIYQEITWDHLLPETPHDGASAAETAIDGKKSEYPPERPEFSAANPALQGKNVKIHGFVVPLERNDEALLTEFLLVPYFGACIHVPPPPQNQIVHVVLDVPSEGVQAMDTVFVYGRIGMGKKASKAGEAAYSLRAVRLERETTPSFSRIMPAVGLTLLCGMSLCLGWVGPVAAITLDRRMVGLGSSFAAGAMTSLGLSATVLNLSMKSIWVFFMGAALMALVKRLSRAQKQPDSAARVPARMGAGSAFAVALHNLPECFIVFSGTMADSGFGLALGGAVLAHNVPLGISLAASSGRGLRPLQAWVYALFAGLLPPLTAIWAYFFLRSMFSPEAIRMLFVCAGGALVFIALTELVPFSRQYGKRTMVSAGFAAGVLCLFFIALFSSYGSGL